MAAVVEVDNGFEKGHPLVVGPGLREPFLRNRESYGRLRSFLLADLTRDGWPVLNEVPGWVSGGLRPGFVYPIFNCEQYIACREGFSVGIVNWRIVHLGVGPTSEDDFDANYMGAHFAVKAILWDGKDGDDSEDALYRILLRKTPDGLLEAVGVQWFVDFVGSEPLWGDCDPGSAYRLLFAIEEIKKLMVAAQKTNSLEVKKLGK